MVEIGARATLEMLGSGSGRVGSGEERVAEGAFELDGVVQQHGYEGKKNIHSFIHALLNGLKEGGAVTQVRVRMRKKWGPQRKKKRH